MLPDARIVHRLSGRLRIKVDSQKRNGAFFSMLSNELRACPGVLDVTVSPVTASVLIQHTAAEAEILQFVAARSLFNLVSSNKSHADVPTQMTAGMRGFSRDLQGVTGDALDLNALIVLGLAGLAIQQAIEGNIMAPAVSLLWYAYNASRMPLPGQEPQPAEVGAPASHEIATPPPRRGGLTVMSAADSVA